VARSVTSAIPGTSKCARIQRRRVTKPRFPREGQERCQGTRSGSIHQKPRGGRKESPKVRSKALQRPRKRLSSTG
jgi:hypothetical protein